MNVHDLLQQLANVPAVPGAENEREHHNPLNIDAVPAVPAVPVEIQHTEVPAVPQPRATAHFWLRGDEGGGTLVGRPNDTYQDLVTDLRERYGERLVDVKPNHEEPDMTDGMTEDERQRMAVVEAGGTVVAHMPRRSARGDAVLIAWAQRTGRFVRIDRKTEWGNPFEIPKHGNRDQVCDAYAEHLAASPDLLARLPELRGKVLGCWCYPKRCHGDEIIKRLAVLP